MELPQFRGRKREIVQRLSRGEEPAQIAAAVRTTRNYVYNVATELRGRGIVLPGPRPRAAGQQPAPVAAHQPAVPEPPPEVTRGAANPDPELRRDIEEREQRVRDLRDRDQLQRRDIAFVVEENRLRDVVKEGAIRRSVADICPNPPEDLYSDRGRFVDVMQRIFSTQDPYRTIVNQVMRGLEWGEESDLRLTSTLIQFYDSIAETGLTQSVPVRSEETFLQDHLAWFLAHLTSPTHGYCIVDTTPRLLLGNSLICAMGHCPAYSLKVP